MKNNIFLPSAIIFFVLAACCSIPTQASVPTIWTYRYVLPSLINEEGAPTNTQATVTLKAWASSDSLVIGLPLDVLFVTDNSGSMGSRTVGQREWVNPTRIQGVYNAAANFVDSILGSRDRVAHIRFHSSVQTMSAFDNNLVRVKARLDTNITGGENGTAVYTAILNAVRYIGQNGRAGDSVTKVIIALTDGEDNASGSYGGSYATGLPNLGNTMVKAVDSVVHIIDSLQATGFKLKVFTVSLGTDTVANNAETQQMKRIAMSGDGEWAYSTTGADLSHIFLDIGHKISDVAAIRLSPATPMFEDVLGPGVHYVPGSFTVNAGSLTPAFSVTTVGGLTQLNFAVDTVKIGQFLEVKYNVTVALNAQDVAPIVVKRLNNLQTDDAVNYSKIQYKLANDSIVSRPMTHGEVRVQHYTPTISDWIDTLIVVYGDTNVTAGDSFKFKIIALNKSGDTVTTLSRLPTGFTIGSDGTLQFVGATADTLLRHQPLTVTDPFTGGTSSNTLVPFSAGQQKITLTIPYVTEGGVQQVYTRTITLNVSVGAPDSISVVRDKNNIPAYSDTLGTTTNGDVDTSVNYRILIYDAYGNLLPSTDPAYPAASIQLQGGMLSTSHLTQSGNKFGYDATGSTTGGKGTVTVRLVSGTNTLTYTFSLVIVPLAQIASITTHEWAADTAGDVRGIEFVLDSVLGLNHTALSAGGGQSLMQVYLAKLREAGYMPYRDGYLDYLDIFFSQPFNLTEAIIAGIRFDWVVSGTPGGATWLLTSGTHSIKVLAVDAATGNGHLQYRVWLIPNVLRAAENPPLETGFLPVIAFSNDAVRQREPGNNAPVLIGSPASTVFSEQAKTFDAAPPVIGGFLFQSNACKAPGTPSQAYILFSEPVQTAAIPYFSSIRAFTLVSRNRVDPNFMQTLILRGDKQDRSLGDAESWNLDAGSTSTMSYRLDIKPESLSIFIPDVTQLLLTRDAAIQDIKDLSGNSANAAPAKPAMLTNDKDNSPAICTINGNTAVYRDQAVSFSWTQTDSGSVPNFHFFGFTVNLQTLLGVMTRNDVQSDPVTVNGRTYIVCDFDSARVLIDSRVNIYDLLGNLTASPASHKGLHETYTAADIRRFLGVDVSTEALRNLPPDKLEQYYSVSRALNPADPDTLRPIYPPAFTIGYDFLLRNCGPGSTPGQTCVPSWNCLNAKGRLVAPGGYVAVQHMRTGATLSEAVRRILVNGTRY